MRAAFGAGAAVHWLAGAGMVLADDILGNGHLDLLVTTMSGNLCVASAGRPRVS